MTGWQSFRLWTVVARAIILSDLFFIAGCVWASAPVPPASDGVVTPSVAVSATRSPMPNSSTALPEVPGLSSEEVASLASLEKLDDYPLYTMHHYDITGSVMLPGPVHLSSSSPAWACSLFAVLGDPEAQVFGRNFDWSYSPALLLFTYPRDGYASASVVDLAFFIDGENLDRLDELPLRDRKDLLMLWRYPFDGMNEHGVVVGMAAVPDSRVPVSADRPSIGSLGIIREILDHARNVDEALVTLARFNVDMEGGPQIHYLIADPAGNSAVVEFYRGEMVVIRNNVPWQAATNFYQAPVSEKTPSPCRRYDTLVAQLAERSGRMNAAEAMSLLSDVAQPNTQWSAVYGMQSGVVRIALGRQYDRVHLLTLKRFRSQPN